MSRKLNSVVFPHARASLRPFHLYSLCSAGTSVYHATVRGLLIRSTTIISSLFRTLLTSYSYMHAHPFPDSMTSSLLTPRSRVLLDAHSFSANHEIFPFWKKKYIAVFNDLATGRCLYSDESSPYPRITILILSPNQFLIVSGNVSLHTTTKIPQYFLISPVLSTCVLMYGL